MAPSNFVPTIGEGVEQYAGKYEVFLFCFFLF